MSSIDAFNPELDLALERVVPVPRRLVWKAWTEPEPLMKWFCPRPWATVSCQIDLRPGGRFATVMRSPEGVEIAGTSCYLLIEPESRLVWTSALIGGFRPHAQPTSDTDFVFTADLSFEEEGGVPAIGRTSCMPPPRRDSGMRTWVFTTAGTRLSINSSRPWPVKPDGRHHHRSEPVCFRPSKRWQSLASPPYPPYLKATSAGQVPLASAALTGADNPPWTC